MATKTVYNPLLQDGLQLLDAGGGGGAVDSVFTRTGDVVATAGDYAASEVDNDSTVSGTTTKDALDSLNSTIQNMLADVSWYDGVLAKTRKLEYVVPDVILSTSGAGDLQTAINALTEGQVLEVQTSAAYSAITLPANKGFSVKVGNGYAPTITGVGAIKISNNSRDIMFSGFVLESNTAASVNWRGACVDFATQNAKCSNIIFYNLTMRNVGANSCAVQLSYHWSIGGDYYGNIPQLSEMSEKVAFIKCFFHKACTSNIEGASLLLRGVKYAYIQGCKIENYTIASRCIMLQNCVNAFIEENDCTDTTGNGEGIKIDNIGLVAPPYRITSYIRANRVKKCVEGIDIDDSSDAYVCDNIVWNCSDDGISLDGGTEFARGQFVNNICYKNAYGITAEVGSVSVLKKNVCFGNTTANYNMLNGYAIDDSNTTDQTDTFIPITADIPHTATLSASQAINNKPNMTVGGAPPIGPATGDFWYDTGVVALKMWNGGVWVLV